MEVAVAKLEEEAAELVVIDQLAMDLLHYKDLLHLLLEILHIQ